MCEPRTRKEIEKCSLDIEVSSKIEGTIFLEVLNRENCLFKTASRIL